MELEEKILLEEEKEQSSKKPRHPEENARRKSERVKTRPDLSKYDTSEERDAWRAGVEARNSTQLIEQLHIKEDQIK